MLLLPRLRELWTPPSIRPPNPNRLIIHLFLHAWASRDHDAAMARHLGNHQYKTGKSCMCQPEARAICRNKRGLQVRVQVMER